MSRGIRLVPLARRRRPVRVPVRVQMTDGDCGAACLAMVLDYYGARVPLAEVRDRCRAGRGGVTAAALSQAADHYGLRVRAYRTEPEHLGALPAPALLHWDFNHFVVLEGATRGGVRIVDPAAGRREVSLAACSDHFTGVALTLEPGEGFKRRRPGKSAAWRPLVSAAAAPLAGHFARVLGASLALVLFGAVPPLVAKVLVDDIVARGVAGLYPVAGAAALACLVCVSLAGCFRSAALVALESRLDASLSEAVVGHLLRLPYAFHLERSAGDLFARVGALSALREALTQQSVSLALDAVLVAGYLAVLVSQNAAFAAVTGALAAAHLFLSAVIILRTRPAAALELSSRSDAQARLLEALVGIGTLKAAGAEAHAVDRWRDAHSRSLAAAARTAHAGALVSALAGGLRALAPTALLVAVIPAVVAGELTLGAALALTALAAAFLSPFLSLVSGVERLLVAGTQLARLDDVLASEPEGGDGLADAPASVSGHFVCEGLSYRYDPSGPDAVDSVSLEIPAGSKVALVGPSGCGKTTLGLLLCGLLTPTRGTVLVDGHDVRTLAPSSLRRHFGVVLQSPALFRGTVRENIAFNAPDLPLDRVLEAAELAGLRSDIERLPLGFDTLLAENGAGLSGGQQQRIALARALAARPAVLLLDEATSNLDVVTERAIERALSGTKATRIVIAHRLSTVRDADCIFVMEAGMIIERGTHEELVEAGGLYASMVLASEGHSARVTAA